MKGFVQRIIGDEISYWNLVNAIKSGAELPICLEHQDPMEAKITLEDMQDFSNKFYKDSGIMPTFEIGVCENCGRLHLHIILNEIEIEEPEE